MQAHDVPTPGTTHRPARILGTRTPETECASPPPGKAHPWFKSNEKQKLETQSTLKFSEKLASTERKTAIAAMEIATPPCLQPFGSEIVCINKALAFFLSLSLDCQMPAVQCPPFAVKFKAMRLTECNLLALKYARPTICFSSLPGWGSHSMAFLNSQRRSQLPWVTKQQECGRWVAAGADGRATSTVAVVQRKNPPANLKQVAKPSLSCGFVRFYHLYLKMNANL